MRFGSVCLTLFMMGLLSEQVAGDDVIKVQLQSQRKAEVDGDEDEDGDED